MNPYQTLPERAFWKLAVANKSLFDISDLWRPKFAINSDWKVATYGSCFAQHIGKALRDRQFAWIDSEPAPYGLSDRSARDFNYGIFSARTGNIYTTSLLKQWTQWAIGDRSPPSEFWQSDGRVFDPFRPVIEPKGFETQGEMESMREHTIRRFGHSIRNSDLFVFTLGLTEAWFEVSGEYEYPICPGAAAGAFDERRHVFRNQHFNEVITNLKASMDLMSSVNKKIKFLLTVSPVPLTATKSGQHVLLATMRSKSILRAVAAQLSETRADVDYFPSYEIISSPALRGVFFEPNMRSVNPRGVAFVMEQFFKSLKLPENAVQTQGEFARDLVCEEELLEAFGKQ